MKEPFKTGANITVDTLAKLIAEHHHVHLELSWDASSLMRTLPGEIKEKARVHGQILKTVTAYPFGKQTIGFVVAQVTDTNEEAVALLKKNSPW